MASSGCSRKPGSAGMTPLEARRAFCRQCGSTLFWQGTGRDYISIAAGTLDDSSGLSTACHIFTADKGGYYEIADSAPQRRDGDFSLHWP